MEAAHDSLPVNVTKHVSAMVLRNTLGSIFGEDYARVASHLEAPSAIRSEIWNSRKPFGRRAG
jgi:hypothetical protein